MYSKSIRQLAFTIYHEGSYRVEASEEAPTPSSGFVKARARRRKWSELHVASGNAKHFQRDGLFERQVDQLGDPDQFDSWAYNRDRRWDNSRSARYLSRDVVGYEDLGRQRRMARRFELWHVWFPSRVEAGLGTVWQGHWDWIPPWDPWLMTNSWAMHRSTTDAGKIGDVGMGWGPFAVPAVDMRRRSCLHWWWRSVAGGAMWDGFHLVRENLFPRIAQPAM